MKKKITYLDTLDSEAYANDLQETLVKVNRSAATVKGGRRFSFNALSVVGNRDGVRQPISRKFAWVCYRSSGLERVPYSRWRFHSIVVNSVIPIGNTI